MNLNTIEKTNLRARIVGVFPTSGNNFGNIKVAVDNSSQIRRAIIQAHRDILECNPEGQVDLEYGCYISESQRPTVDASGSVMFLTLKVNREAIELYGANKELKSIDFFVDRKDAKDPHAVGFRLVHQG